MKMHPNAKTTPRARALMVQRVEAEGWTSAEAAEAAGVSERTVYKWRARFRDGGGPSLADRASRPGRMPYQTPAGTVHAILRWRRARLCGGQIGLRLGVPRSTVGAILRRHGLGQLGPLAPPHPIRRYERQRAGELLHIDIKPLARIGRVGHRIHGDRRTRGRGIGMEQVHVCIDDASRVAYAEVLPTARQGDAVGFLERAVQWYATHGVTVEGVMTDNGSAYVSRAWARTCRRLSLRHLRTRPYTPQTNGKAERFIQTVLREWAYHRPFRTSGLRRRALRPWLRHYNRRRPHTSLNFRPPLTRLQELVA